MEKNSKNGKRTYKTAKHSKQIATNNKSIKSRFEDFAYTKEYKEYLAQEEKQKYNTNLNSINTTIRKKHSGIKWTFSTILGLIVIILIIGGIFFIPYISQAIKSYENGFDTTKIDVESVPHIYDNQGNLICVMYGYYDNGKEDFVPTYSSVYTDINTLPKYIGNAFTAIEDETFYDNSGISINRLLYASFNYIVKGDSSFGGSTITQQLVKVATGDNSHSPSRKAREIGSALYLTDNWSKEKILGSYINLVYYGNGAYGIYEASLTYFNTEPQNLNIAQAAVLAALPNSPENLNPYSGEKNITKLVNRQKLVLKKMLELSLISEDEYKEALNFKLEFNNGSKNIIKNDPATSQYLNIAFTQAIEIVKGNYSCSASEAIDKILYGKTKIHLNLDSKLQNSAYNLVVSNYSDYPDLELGTVITKKSGEVLAIISSRTGSNIDHAYSMKRQTGSSIKPISVYAPAYDMKLIKPNSYVYDNPVTLKTSSGNWNVQNANRKYRGKLTVNDAIAYSVNTTAITTLEKVSLNKSLEYVKSFGITSVDKDDLYYPALGLGGFTYGISPYEMTQAYNTFNNDGVFKSISTIKNIEIDGKNISKNTNEHRVISTEANTMIKTSLNCVAKYGTGKSANLGNIKSYVKTGTTSDTKDVWTCGFTDDITACVWSGYDKPKTLPIGNVNATWKQLIKLYYR